MERGNAKHSPREDDMLAAELSGTLGPGGSCQSLSLIHI